MKHTIGRFFGHFLSVALFVTVAAVAVFFAYGYRFDGELGRVQKTSIIDIPAPRAAADVFLDGVEKANSLPTQLKNVLPGDHELIVRKDGFIPWSRTVNVKEDVVSIVRDVLLVPAQLDEFVEPVGALEEGEEYIAGEEYVLAYIPGSNVVRSMVFGPAGTVREEELSFFEEGFVPLQTFDDDQLFLLFPNDLYALLDLDDPTFAPFALPPGVEDVTMDIKGRQIYFRENRTLYAAPLEELDEERMFAFDPALYREVHTDVDQFFVSSSGHLFFTTMGMLYRTDRQGNEFRLMERQPQSIQNMTAYTGEGFDALVVTEVEGNMLLWIDPEGVPHLVSSDVATPPFLDERGRILYAGTDGSLFSYDTMKEENRFIRTFEGDYKLIGWFDDAGHYLFSVDGTLLLDDLYHQNEVALREMPQPREWFVHNKAIFWLVEEGTLHRLFWEI